jgi:hypothetical protein
MSIQSFFNQRCTISRPTAEVARDRYNANVYSGVTVGAEVACRLVEKSVKIMNEQSAEYSWIKAKVLLLPAGTDARVNDEIIIGDVTYLAQSVLSRTRGNAEHHLSVVVEALNV